MTVHPGGATGPHVHRTDDELAEAARHGDNAAVEELLRSHMQRIHSTCRRLCRDRGDAEDAAQEALVAIARGLEGFDGRSSVSSWIYRITTNACIDELRRRRRRPEPSGDAEEPIDRFSTKGVSDEPLEAAISAEQRVMLLDALAELGEDYRIAVVLRDVADLDYAAIAEATDVPVGTVRSRIARGRGRLARILGDEANPARRPDAEAGTESRPPSSERGEDQ